MRPLFLAAALLTLASPAFASGGLWCDVNDENLLLKVSTGVTRGGGNGFFHFTASAEVKVAGTPADMRELGLDEGLTHSWIDGETIRLLLYAERNNGEFAGVKIEVDAPATDEGEYIGTYTLTLEIPETAGDGPKVLTGAVSCGAE